MDLSWMPGVASWAGFVYLLKTKVNNREMDKSIYPRLEKIETKIDKMLDHWKIEK